MISAKQAAQAAKEYIQELTETQLLHISLEEVEISDDEQFWYITLSFETDYLARNKQYKIFKIRSEDGEVISMKIRTPNEQLSF